jgi:hypothetical protein
MSGPSGVSGYEDKGLNGLAIRSIPKGPLTAPTVRHFLEHAKKIAKFTSEAFLDWPKLPRRLPSTTAPERVGPNSRTRYSRPRVFPQSYLV